MNSYCLIITKETGIYAQNFEQFVNSSLFKKILKSLNIQTYNILYNGYIIQLIFNSNDSVNFLYAELGKLIPDSLFQTIMIFQINLNNLKCSVPNFEEDLKILKTKDFIDYNEHLIL